MKNFLTLNKIAYQAAAILLFLLLHHRPFGRVVSPKEK
jgi:hypothetical protein